MCRLAPVIPVLVIEDASRARPLAEALVAGGLPVLEVTLRTPAALAVIRAMAEVRGGVVGAGTVLSERDVVAAKQAGALFAVSPGATDALLSACEAHDLPILPGAATATEAAEKVAGAVDSLEDCAKSYAGLKAGVDKLVAEAQEQLDALKEANKAGKG